jgi:ABC-type multidrug transport system ATPase subunit
MRSKGSGLPECREKSIMSNTTAVIEIDRLVRRYGRTDAVDGLDLRVEPGRCYGFFGRNGAGKTTTIKCLLNLLRPTAGEVKVFGMDPSRHEVAVKSRLAYVPDSVAFYPWMTVRDTLDYFASFRPRWNHDTERALIDQFRLNPAQKTSHLSKGQRTQVALVSAVCPEPDLLVLDEPTSGLDPIVRREFIQTVIGAYQDGDPGRRTVFVSTHLISEFEGLIDEFTIIEHGRNVLTMSADAARERYQKIHARFAVEPSGMELGGVRVLRRRGKEIELVVNGDAKDVMDRLRTQSLESLSTESLSLEEIFVATLHPEAAIA